MPPTIDEAFQAEYHTCDCPSPSVKRSALGALGKFTTIHLCCMANALQAWVNGGPAPTGITIIQNIDVDPSFVWDGGQVMEIEPERKVDGVTTAAVMGTVGDPPNWMHVRMHSGSIGHKHTSSDSLTHTH